MLKDGMDPSSSGYTPITSHCEHCNEPSAAIQDRVFLPDEQLLSASRMLLLD
jgi:hypothetical protein